MIGGKDIEFKCAVALELIEPVRKIVLGHWPAATVVEEVAPNEHQLFLYRDKAAFDSWAADGATPELSNTMVHLIFTSGQMTAVVDDENEPTIRGMLSEMEILLR